MPTADNIHSTTPTIDVYVKLAQYPILSDQIRLRMREELFRRGIVSQEEFEAEVKEHAQESQRREGLSDPYSQEDEVTWQRRLDNVRDMHTDAYFGNNLGPMLLEQIIEEVLNHQDNLDEDATELTFNPEIAPWELLFRQGAHYESLSPPQQEEIQHHLEELKVVLIKRLISDHLPFIGIAKHIFTVQDLRWIYDRLIGSGKIGGKAGGMILAWKILAQPGASHGPDISSKVSVPESYFLGSETIYDFMYQNKLERFVNQKYLPLDEMSAQYPEIVAAWMQGDFPPYVVEQLEEILNRVGQRPFVVRSSSLLEDNLSYDFVSKYESHICVNQGTREDNLAALLRAIRQVYASVFKPEVMQERQEHGLIDYDERMAILIQPLCGRANGRYFWPTAVGVGLSRNLYSETFGGRVEDGLLRLVWGFDEQKQNQFAVGNGCIVSLEEPKSCCCDGRAGVSPQAEVKVIDLKLNCFRYLPVETLLTPQYPDLSFVATAVNDDETAETPAYVLTFNYLIQDPKFIKLIRTALLRLEAAYEMPIELEFALELLPNGGSTDYLLHILQCRPWAE